MSGYYCAICGKKLNYMTLMKLKVFDFAGNTVDDADLCRRCLPKLERFLRLGEGTVISPAQDPGHQAEKLPAAGSNPGKETRRGPKRKEMIVETPKVPTAALKKIDIGKARALFDAGWDMVAISFECHCSEEDLKEILAERM